MDKFPIIEVPTNAPEQWEAVGTKPKFWFKKCSTLFKECRQETGEDWSEKIAAELAELLGLPHAQVDLASWKGKRGIVSPTFVPDGGALVLGNELLRHIVDNYPSDPSGIRSHYRVPQHTLAAILATLRWRPDSLPIDWFPPKDVTTTVDVFLGYLLLDTWIGNQDRHHANWGFIAIPGAEQKGILEFHLAPTFDHASSLGRNESDKKRNARLTTTDTGYSIDEYVKRARSAIYDEETDKNPMSTIDVFALAFKLAPAAGIAWLNRLDSIPENDVKTLFQQIPEARISQAAIEFAVRMLRANRIRLLELRTKLL